MDWNYFLSCLPFFFLRLRSSAEKKYHKLGTSSNMLFEVLGSWRYPNKMSANCFKIVICSPICLFFIRKIQLLLISNLPLSLVFTSCSTLETK